ncbi:MAG TPA: M13 family metallopeptidase [Rubricoccaceae bacterium]|jgi:endothelin-converting enzyme/putative endopeptidase
MRAYASAAFAALILAAPAVLTPAAQAQTMRSGIDRANLDPAVRPQDDFFRYANGGWLATTQIPADRSRFGSFDVLGDAAERHVRAIIEDAAAGRVEDRDARRVGDYYTAYMDSARVERLGLEPLEYDFDRIDDVDDAEDLVRYFAQNGRTFGPSPVGMYVGVDDKNSSRYVFNVVQSGTGLPDRSYYLEDRFADARAGYLTYLTTLFTLANAEDIDDTDDAAGRAARVVALETDLARAQWTRVQNRDPEATYNPMSVSGFEAAYPNLRFGDMLDEMDLDGRIDSVVVAQPPFFSRLDSLMAAVPLQTWNDYARVQTLSEAAGVLPSAFANARFNFYGRQLSGQQQDRPRWKKAVAATAGTFGESVGRVYVARHYPAAAAGRMDALIGNLREAFRASITDLAWMSPETRQRALDKLNTYTYKIGAPTEWEAYEGLDVEDDDLVGNLRNASAWAYTDMMSKLGTSPDRTEWGMTPQTVNAYYNPAFNEIVFPAAILQPPFFDVEADDAINYGGIGAVIGHEFSHGFDDQGSQYDAQGNLRNWWTDADRAAFEERADRLAAQYDAYAPFPDANVNGRLTLGENIADLSGLTMAYRAYQRSLDKNQDGTVSQDEQAPVIDGFTGDQRFFMGWAGAWRSMAREAALRQQLQTDPHSPGEYRANGPLGHLDAFYTAFDVQPGDPMYVAPEDRIRLW